VSYQPLDAAGGQGFGALSEKVGTAAQGLAIFLSTAPSLFEPTIAGLKGAGLTEGNVRIGLEKPLGTSLASSREINDAVAAAFSEERIFRIDHYLGKETVQNLLALRFANLLFEPIWNANYIDHVQITVAETVGLESRAGYYDGSGALRDMVQNHMLQLLALVAMEPPTSFDATAVRDEKVKVLRSLRRATEGEAVTGQYRGGAIDGVTVPGYDQELGKPSDTETFVAIKAHVDNWRWKGVPFYLRTGKRLPERVTEIVIQFRQVPFSIFAGRGAKTQPNRLVIRIQPEENVSLSLMAKVPGLDRDGIRLRPVPLDISMPDALAGAVRRIAYERLLLDLIEGDQTLFVRRDEVEAQWAWIDAIRADWSEQGLVPKPYPAGTWGPSAAIALAERDGVTWHE
jgi:glucose-6-phosphate 1-dehydrogenase